MSAPELSAAELAEVARFGLDKPDDPRAWQKSFEAQSEAVAVAARSVWDLVDAANEDELVQLIADARKATTTNCGWFVYRAAQMIIDEANMKLAHLSIPGSSLGGGKR